MQKSEVIDRARDYYNSQNMLHFHQTIYGENIHVGIYDTSDESISAANLNALELIFSKPNLSPSSKVLDLGSGYGGPARYLAQSLGCSVDCLNLSEAQNEINRNLNHDRGLSNLIQVLDGSFQTIPAPDNTYDFVLSQDALLYSDNRQQVFQEVSRSLRPGGQFLITDVMLASNCPEDIRLKTLKLVNLESLASIENYCSLAQQVGFDVLEVVEMHEQVVRQYQATLDTLDSKFDELKQGCDLEFIEYQRTRLGNWVEIGRSGYLNWGILHFSKP